MRPCLSHPTLTTLSVVCNRFWRIRPIYKQVLIFPMAPIWRRVWPVTIHLALVYKRVCLVDRVRRLVYIASLSSTFSCRSLPQSRVFLMSSPGSPALQQLYHLDRSSSDFHDRLCNVFYGSEYSQCVPNLEGDDLVWLVDYLDKVCCRVTFPRPLLQLA